MATLFAPRRSEVGNPSADGAANTAAPRNGRSKNAAASPAGKPSARSVAFTKGRETAALLLFVAAIFTTLALFSFAGHPTDPTIEGSNWVGPVGATWARFLIGTIGFTSWAVPVELLMLAWPLLKDRASIATITKLAGDFLVLLVVAALIQVALPNTTINGEMPAAGAVGELFGELMRSLFSTIGSFLIGLTAIALILIGRASFSFIAWVQRATHGTEVAATKAKTGAIAVAQAWERAAELRKQRELDAKPVVQIHEASADAAIVAAIGADDMTPSPASLHILHVEGRKPAPPAIVADDDARTSAAKPAARKAIKLVIGINEPTPTPVSAGVEPVRPAAVAAALEIAAEPARMTEEGPGRKRVRVRRSEDEPAVRVAEIEPAVMSTPLADPIVTAEPAPEPRRRGKARDEKPAEPVAEPIIHIHAQASAQEPAPVAASVATAPVRAPVISAPRLAAPAISAPESLPEPSSEESFDASAFSSEPPSYDTPAPVSVAARPIASAIAPAPARVAREAAPPVAAAPAPVVSAPRPAAPRAPARPEPIVDEHLSESPSPVVAPIEPPSPSPLPVRAAAPRRPAEPQVLIAKETHLIEKDEASSRGPNIVAPVEKPAPAPVMSPRPAMPDTVIVRSRPAAPRPFTLPGPDLLEPPSTNIKREDPEVLRIRARELEKVLSNYGVKGTVADIHTGPTVSTFEVVPAEGTKVRQVAGLDDDLALGLSCKVRIVAPIPGKSRIGFELPNRERIPVNLRELIEDRRFLEMNVPLPMVLGRDIVGSPVYADLSSFPHVIVAGATGAGKSVGLNVMLISLLMRRTPEQVRLLMVDPKVVELAPFDRIPHLLLPVVTDMKQASNALKWAVDEMERRYQLFANAGTKNIGTYNNWVERVQRGEVKGFGPGKSSTAVHEDGTLVEVGPEKDGPPLPDKLPWIVIVVDEFADLIMQQGKDVEASIARLAQKARAAGMHVILATQRPSTDVITGTIKSNFPSRVAFRVVQWQDSKTILDEKGAEQLLGKGDMLVKLNGATETRRVQGPFVFEEEVQRVTDFLREQGEPVYDESIIRNRDEDDAGSQDDDENLDPRYDEAVRVVAETQKCSTSWLQRKLGLGYNRAAKIVEVMEKRGVVGPANGAKDREVLIAPL